MEYLTLPKKYWAKQDYLLYAYDVIADMIRQADKKKLSTVNLEFKDKEHAQSFEKAEDMFEWMDNNGYHDISVQLFQKHVFFCLLRDFCYYIYESINCSQRGKVTVAYSLLRKPLRDNLLYIEWLLADAEEFYQTFLYEEIKKCDTSNFSVFSQERIQEVIKVASQKTYMGENINYDNLVYTFRFNNKDVIGLQRIWNQSMHLVTTSPNYPTEKGNLNFIFANKKIWDYYWDYYYLVLPQLMAYVIEICEAIFTTTTKIDTFELQLNRTIRFAKYANIQPRIKTFETLKKQPYELIEVFNDSSISPCFKCETCRQNIIITKRTVEEMINDWAITCPQCGQKQSICKYYTEVKYLHGDKAIKLFK